MQQLGTVLDKPKDVPKKQLPYLWFISFVNQKMLEEASLLSADGKVLNGTIFKDGEEIKKFA